MTCDSGSRSESRDRRARAEGRQSGGKAASPELITHNLALSIVQRIFDKHNSNSPQARDEIALELARRIKCPK